MNDQVFSKALGWFSIGLGAAELLAPAKLSKATGLQNHTTLLRALGAREILHGIAILSAPRSPRAVGSRIVGDAMDLAVLGTALFAKGSNKVRVATATAAVLGVAAADIVCTQRLTKKEARLNGGRKDRALPVVKSVIINRPAEELYRFWRNLENLPNIMPHLKSVTVQDDTRSHWVVKAPLGMNVEWDAEIVRDDPGRLIAWRSLPGATVDNWGSVTFVPLSGDRGTAVRAEFEYRPPAGVLGRKIAKLFGQAPEQQVGTDLRPFKQLMETGEITTTEGQPSGRATSTSKRYDETLKNMAAS